MLCCLAATLVPMNAPYACVAPTCTVTSNSAAVHIPLPGLAVICRSRAQTSAMKATIAAYFLLLVLAASGATAAEARVLNGLRGEEYSRVYRPFEFVVNSPLQATLRVCSPISFRGKDLQHHLYSLSENSQASIGFRSHETYTCSINMQVVICWEVIMTPNRW